MKKVAIIGAGWMTQPLVDYLMETCGYFVIVANRTDDRHRLRIVVRPGAYARTGSERNGNHGADDTDKALHLKSPPCK